MATTFPNFVDVPDGDDPEPGVHTPVDAAFLNSLTGAVNIVENQLPSKANDADLHAVATSGAYTDLIGKPFIPDSPDDIGAQPAGSYATTVQLDGKANTAHTHGVTDLTATGTKDATTFLRGDNTWAVPAGGGGGGATDHGVLTGLTDDDHPQYHNDARGDVRYYTKAQVDTSLGTKSNDGHTHAYVAASSVGAASGVAALDSSVRVPTAQMPRVSTTVRSIAHATTVAINAATDGNLINIAATAAETIGEPTGGTDRQVIRLAVYCASAQTITFASAIRLSTGLATRAFAVPTGQALIAALEFVNALPSSKWVLTAATITAA